VNTLATLPVGSRARVARIDGTDEISCRLMEMGLTPGAEVSLVGVAPLGDPLELELRGYRLSIRRSEAARVAIELTLSDRQSAKEEPMTNDQ
jgi:ferrous iron transport protein A